MKRCPTCQSIYTDDSLAFCLQDGSMLLTASNTQAVSNTQALSDTQSSSDTQAPFDPDATLRAPRTTLGEAPLTETIDPRAAPTVEIQSPAQTVAHSRASVAAAESSTAVSSKRALRMGIFGVTALLLVLAGIGIASLIRGERDSRRNARIWGDRRSVADNINTFGGTGNSNNPNATPAPTSSNSNQSSVPAPPLSITVTASSTRANYKGVSYAPGNVLDGNPQTAWAEGAGGAGVGEWVRCDFNREISLRRITIAPGYFKNRTIWARNNRLSAATVVFSDGSSRKFNFPNDMKRQTLDVGAVKTSSVKIVIRDVYQGDDPDTAISEIAFDWEP
jgi:hypothetical protein